MADFNLPSFEQLLNARKGLGSGYTAKAGVEGGLKGIDLAEQIKKRKMEEMKDVQNLELRKADFARKVAALNKDDSRPYFSWIGYNDKGERLILNHRKGYAQTEAEIKAQEPQAVIPNVMTPQASPAMPGGQGLIDSGQTPKYLESLVAKTPQALSSDMTKTQPQQPSVAPMPTTPEDQTVRPRTAHIPQGLLSQEISGKKIENIVDYVDQIVSKMPKGGIETIGQLGQGLAGGWLGGDVDVMAYQQARPTWGRTLYKNFSTDVGNIAENEGDLATALMPDLKDAPALREAKAKALRRASKQSMEIVAKVNKMFQTGQIDEPTAIRMRHDGVTTALTDALSTLNTSESPRHDKNKNIILPPVKGYKEGDIIEDENSPGIRYTLKNGQWVGGK